MDRWTAYLWVGLGGFLGANARFLVARLTQSLLGVGFPYGTFLINISGSFLLGLVTAFLAQRMLPYSDQMRLAISVGFLGAYTTFSTFSYESNALLQDGEWLWAGVNVVGSVVLGLLAVRAGIMLGRL